MPFIVSALKVNATLALIGAIVAEFFGSPTVGLGFRISTEAAKRTPGLGAIVVAAVTGSVAALVQPERRWVVRGIPRCARSDRSLLVHRHSISSPPRSFAMMA